MVTPYLFMPVCLFKACLMWTSNPKYTVSGLHILDHRELSYLYSPPDPTLIVENVVGVMENVAVERRKEVWFKSGIVPHPQLEKIYQKYSTEEQRIHACADIYVNFHPESSWTHLCERLYWEKEMTAVRKAKPFIPQTGKQWRQANNRLASTPGPLREEKGPGTHCLRLLRYPKNLRGLDIIVYLSYISAYMSVFYSLLLDTCPLNHAHSDRVIQLQTDQFYEITNVKKDWQRS